MARKRYDEVKVNFVGRFFEDITRAMVVCERAPAEEGDFHIWNKGIGIEVKASDANHEFRLPLHQLEIYRKISGGFPFNNFFFFLFCYENCFIKNGGQNKITSLSQYDEKVDVRNFLAENLSTLFIIDLSVVNFLFSVCRISDKSIPLHPGVKSLNIRPTYLQRLADGGWRAMIGEAKNSQLKSFTCEFRFNPDLLESYNMKFKVVIICRTKEVGPLLSSIHPQIALR